MTTRAGKGLLKWLAFVERPEHRAGWSILDQVSQDVPIIETEAVAAERERIAAEVEEMWPDSGDPRVDRLMWDVIAIVRGEQP